ncbi:MAG: DMT family transporter, partial [Phototrophicaceae bacterium]
LISGTVGQKITLRTFVRVVLALVALLMITGFSPSALDWAGVGLMLGSALMFAGTIILSQYVLYEMPAPTVTLYMLSTMAVVVSMVWLAVGEPLSQEVLELALPPIFLLGVSTGLSRLAMFAGVKFLGGQQTAFLAITEIGVALTLAFIFLGDRLTAMQWVGVFILSVSLMLIRQRDFLPHGYNPNALVVANMASVQFQRIAFHRAFGTRELDNEMGTMTAITPSEMLAIQRMMGAQLGGIDPYPIGKSRRWQDQQIVPPPVSPNGDIPIGDIVPPIPPPPGSATQDD